MKNAKWITGLILAAGITVTSCKKDFFDINKNPNNPENVDIKFVFPNAIQYTGYVMGNYYQIWGGIWSQYWAQGPTASQYVSWDRYIQSNNEMDRPWSQMYAGALSDLNYVQKEATAAGKKNYAACAMIMKAYCFQYMTDLYGDVPFSQALLGTANLRPAYDAQRSIYKGLETMLIQAASQIDDHSDVHPGAEDVLFGGDMAQWKAFANTLRLRVYLRQSETAEEAARCKDSVGAMFARGDAFLDADVRIDYTGAQFQSNPLNTTISSLGDFNLLASKSIIDAYINESDPRIDILFKKASTGASAGQYVGMVQGAAYGFPTTSSTQHTNWSLPSNAVGGGQNQAAGKAAPVYLMSAAESYFLQAEAYARGWATGSTGKDEYENGVVASFAQWGLTPGDAATYLGGAGVAYPTGGSATDKVKAIITQKWYSFCGSQNVEAWTEFRRTKYPDFLTPSTTSTLSAGKFPARFVLPSDEITRNPNAINKTVDTKVWWDQKP
ncbi:MAG: SusD/RagB family nutrient-binding outer membrane lipoprotein [Bacteroidetes bacterium]|nr:SusD/RagB family nutrient-binding outer membrane lipoprotein [Bacteroidota bacterium]